MCVCKLSLMIIPPSLGNAEFMWQLAVISQIPKQEIKALDQRVSEEHACIFVPSCLAVSQRVSEVEGWGGYKTSMDLGLPFK